MPITPGPWQLETVKTQVGICHKIGAFATPQTRKGITYACVYDDCNTLEHPNEELLANAKAIAAVPDMIGALKYALTSMDAVAECPSDWREERAIVRAALEKAGIEI